MILGKKVHLQRLRLWCLYVSYRIACDVLISSASFQCSSWMLCDFARVMRETKCVSGWMPPSPVDEQPNSRRSTRR